MAPAAARLNLRVPAALHRKVTAAARANRRSVNQEAVLLLEAGLGAANGRARGGYEPAASGPAPTAPPPQRADSRRAASPEPSQKPARPASSLSRSRPAGREKPSEGRTGPSSTGLCPHRVPAGQFCKKCARGEP